MKYKTKLNKQEKALFKAYVKKYDYVSGMFEKKVLKMNIKVVLAVLLGLCITALVYVNI